MASLSSSTAPVSTQNPWRTRSSSRIRSLPRYTLALVRRNSMAASPSAPAMLTDDLRVALDRAQKQVNALVLGKPHEVRLAFVALLSGGHLLIEDLPGLGKTTL